MVWNPFFLKRWKSFYKGSDSDDRGRKTAHRGAGREEQVWAVDKFAVDKFYLFFCAVDKFSVDKFAVDKFAVDKFYLFFCYTPY